MDKEKHTDGPNKVIIQEATESTIAVNVNGEVHEIRNELAELKGLLQSLKAQKVQYAEKIYNIEHINEANFGFMTGKKAFNEYLSRQLIEAIRPHSIAAQRFLERVADIPAWESQARISAKAKEVIAYSFVGVVGIQLSKLMAIGKEELSGAKQHKYISKCLDIARRCIDLLSITLLSSLWDEQKTQPRAFDEAERNTLSAFFDNSFEPSLPERFQCLQTLHRIFSKKENALDWPLPEWEGFAPALDSGSAFHQGCHALAALNERLDKGQYSLLDCFEAEKQLALFFQPLSFLANYHMASIRHIGYQEPRNTDARYLHRYTALGIDNKANVDAEKVNCTPETVQTDAVLLYRGDQYSEYINLSPFVIDYNALAFEHGAKICFYRSQAIDGDILEYLFLEDNSLVRLEKQGILKPDTDLNELMMEKEKQKILNLDRVVEQFWDARRCLLGGGARNGAAAQR
ncbi:MAG: hypothetical protein H6557_18890 [Lewinellaceae bacterium]|nr:hypothetical protein [Phaeodactylibacter sp.]MCB9038683.1 hypothetical protein [Lewinellaceae bacterium]